MTETTAAEVISTPMDTPNFEDLLAHPHLLEGLKTRLGFSKPTPIQVSSMPPILEGRNVFAGAKTGSGKTIAFLAPIAQRILDGKATKALILAPTRELVLQIDEEADKLLTGQTEVVCVPLFGGVPVDPQVLALRVHKPRILVATPGRVIDLMTDGVLDLSDVDIMVLDEADRMCDMGFAPQVTKIFDFCPAIKQTLFFSATLPEELTGVMERYCVDPVRIQVDPSDQSSETINHRVVFCNRHNKISKLLELIRSSEVTSLIFVRTRNGADRLYRALLDTGETLNLGILHAGYEMSEREATLRGFKESAIRTLIATDVAARGIDVDTITHVIHFDLPDKLEDYIHRSGRSGRAGRSGTTYALVNGSDRDEMTQFREFSKKVNFEPQGPIPEKDFENEPRREHRHHGDRKRHHHSRDRDPREKRSHHSRDRQERHEHKRDKDRTRDSRTHKHSGKTKPHQHTKTTSPATPVGKIKKWLKGLFR